MAVIMAAMSGIIGGEVVLLGLIALPQMLRLGYNQNLAIGTICASGSLGTMIPPSIVLIIYGLITETSIKALFTGAFMPGFMLASFIIIYIVIRTQLNPSLAPLPEPRDDDQPGAEKLKHVRPASCPAVQRRRRPVLVRARCSSPSPARTPTSDEDDFEPIFLGMASHLPWLAGLHGGRPRHRLFVFGRERSRSAAGSTARAWCRRLWSSASFSARSTAASPASPRRPAWARWRSSSSPSSAARPRSNLIWDSLMRTLRSTGTIIWVTVGAAALSGAYTLAGGPAYIAELIVGAEMPTMLVLLTMMLILLFMGAFMDWVGIVLLIIPVFLPIVKRLPIEEIGFIGQLSPSQVSIWFGVLFCMNMQVSFLSPPFGPAAFYLKSVAPPHISLTDIFRGFLPFIGVQLLALSVLLIWPSIVTILL